MLTPRPLENMVMVSRSPAASTSNPVLIGTSEHKKHCSLNPLFDLLRVNYRTGIELFEVTYRDTINNSPIKTALFSLDQSFVSNNVAIVCIHSINTGRWKR